MLIAEEIYGKKKRNSFRVHFLEDFKAMFNYNVAYLICWSDSMGMHFGKECNLKLSNF